MHKWILFKSIFSANGSLLSSTDTKTSTWYLCFLIICRMYIKNMPRMVLSSLDLCFLVAFDFAFICFVFFGFVLFYLVLFLFVCLFCFVFISKNIMKQILMHLSWVYKYYRKYLSFQMSTTSRKMVSFKTNDINGLLRLRSIIRIEYLYK